MERASYLIVSASVALAVLTHMWLVSWQPALAPAALTVFALTFALARRSLAAGLLPALFTAYLAPALLATAFGSGDYHLILVWLAALAGPVLARGDRRWHLPHPWRTPLIGWALVLAISWPVVALREVDFSLAAAASQATTNGVSGATPAAAAAFVVLTALAQMLGILWINLLWAKLSPPRSTEFVRVVLIPLVAGAAVGALAGVYQAVVDPDWMNPGFWSNLQRAGGLMRDANTFGMGAAIWGPMAIAAAWHAGRGVGLASAACGLLAAGMWASGSRTGLVCLAIGGAGVAIGVLQRRGLWRRELARTALAAGAAVFLLAVIFVPRNFESTNPLQRAFARVPRLEAAEMRRFADELWNRFGYGKAAAQMIADHPLTGVGIGAFHVVAPDYIYNDTGRVLAPDNAQNWWRHQLAELGLLGAAPSILLSLLIVALLRQPGNADYPTGVSTILRTVLAGVGIVSLVGVPTQHPATWLSFATVFFFLAAASAPRRAVAGDTPARGWLAAACAVALAVSVGQAISARGDLRVPFRAANVGMAYSYGVSPPEGDSPYGEVRHIASRAVAVVPVQHPWYQLTFWHPDPDSGEPVTVSVSLDRRRVIDRVLEGREAETFVVEVPGGDGERWAVVEMSTSGAVRAPGVRIAHRWLRRIPDEVAPERVVSIN